jgi:hypothetical protein
MRSAAVCRAMDADAQSKITSKQRMLRSALLMCVRCNAASIAIAYRIPTRTVIMIESSI